jgi:hypothetical protein
VKTAVSGLVENGLKHHKHNQNLYNNICVFCHVYTASIVTRILIVIRFLLIFSLNELMREIKTLFFAMKVTCSVIAAEHAPIISIHYQVVNSCEDSRFGFGPLLICI